MHYPPLDDILNLADVSSNAQHVSRVAELEKAAFKQYELTVQMLNESMDLCLR